MLNSSICARLNVELAWIDQNIDGRPYGVDLIVPTSFESKGQDVSRKDMVDKVPEQHRAFVRGILAEHGIDSRVLDDGPAVSGTRWAVNMRDDGAMAHHERGRNVPGCEGEDAERHLAADGALKSSHRQILASTAISLDRCLGIRAGAFTFADALAIHRHPTGHGPHHQARRGWTCRGRTAGELLRGPRRRANDLKRLRVNRRL